MLFSFHETQNRKISVIYVEVSVDEQKCQKWLAKIHTIDF